MEKTAEKINTFSYLVTKFDKYGWADAERSLPIPFDLVIVLTNTDKKIIAWWNQVRWDGFKLRPKDKIIKWKRRKYEQLN